MAIIINTKNHKEFNYNYNFAFLLKVNYGVLQCNNKGNQQCSVQQLHKLLVNLRGSVTWSVVI